MKVIPKHFLARPNTQIESRFSSEGVAREFAGQRGKIDIIETAYIFDSVKEKELFETRAMRFSEEFAALNLNIIPNEKGFKLFDELIQKKGIENVVDLIYKPIEKTDMEKLLMNRLSEAKFKRVIDILRLDHENDFLKFRQFGKKSLALLKKWLKDNGLELGMFQV